MPRPLVVFRQSLAHLTRFRYVSYVTIAADRAVLPAVIGSTVDLYFHLSQKVLLGDHRLN
jgi:hypothetical protein